MQRISTLIVLTACLIGCNDKKPKNEGTVAPYSDRTLSVHFPENDELAEFLDPFVEEWNARTGAEATLVPFKDQQTIDFSPGDVVLTEVTDIPTLSDQLAIVPDGSPGRDELGWRELLPGLRDRVLKRGREPRLVPISCPPLVCYYRKDLLDAASLEPPNTWAEYNKLVGTIDQWAPGLKPVEPWHTDTRAMMFTARSIAYASPPDGTGVFFNTDSGKPQLATDGFVRALEQFQQIAPALAHSWEMTPTQCREALLRGDAAIGLGYEPVTSTTAIDRAENSRLGFCRLPGSNEVFSQSLKKWNSASLNRPALVGFDGHVAGVIKADDTVAEKAAFSLLASIIDATTATQGTPLRGFTANWHGDVAPDMFEPQLTVDEATEYVSVSLESLKNSNAVLFMPIPNADAFASALSKVLTPDSVANKPATELLSAIDGEWSKLVESAAPDFLNNYRQNVGLRKRK